MRAAYWLAFALASIPYFSYLVAMMFIGPVFSRLNKPSPKGRGLPTWLLLLFSLPAFGFAIWQQISMFFFFDPLPDYTNLSSYEPIVEQEVFGVTIPIELGKTINSFVSSVFFALILTAPIISAVFALLRNRSLPQSERPVPSWAGYVFLVVYVSLIASSGRYFFISAIRDWQTLF